MQNFGLDSVNMGEIEHEKILDALNEINGQELENKNVNVAGGNPDEERNELKRQIEAEKAKSQQLQSLLNKMNSSNSAGYRKSNPAEVSEDLKNGYEEIFNAYGVEAANNWIKHQLVTGHLNVQMENEAVCREIQQKYAEIYADPTVKDAIQAYINLDLDSNSSLKEQGLDMAMEYINSIYKAGYQAAMNLKNQNDAAKSRMGSSVNSFAPGAGSGKVFSRQEIRAMSPQDFLKNEKAIFEQLNMGLIR